MLNRRILSLCVVALTALLSVPLGAAVQPRYRVRDLGTLGGNASYGLAVNAKGVVVGEAQTASGELHAFIWLPRKACALKRGMNDLGTLGGTRSGAYSINDKCEVVGYSTVAGDASRHAFLWLPFPAYGLPKGMHDLGTLGGNESVALAMDNEGRIFGYAALSDGTYHAVQWAGTAITDRDPGGSLSTIEATAAVAQAGGTGTVGGPTTATVFDGGVVRPIPGLGGSNSYAYGINEAGEVVGSADLPGDTRTHPFLFRAGGTVDLGLIPGANSGFAIRMNEAGVITGVVDQAPRDEFSYPTGRGMVWTRHGRFRFDLNSCIPASAGVEVRAPYGLSENGAIAAYGIKQGKRRALLLTPR
jgi:probable HAF family extracellular repeat protein